VIALGGVIGSMALVDDVRSQLWWSLGSLAAVFGAYWLRTIHGSPARAHQSGARTSSISTG
jgi:hypothetical protein